jgi:hypothetical protein
MNKKPKKKEVKMDIVVIAVTNDLVFDYFFSIFINLLWILAPMFAGLSLFSR